MVSITLSGGKINVEEWSCVCLNRKVYLLVDHILNLEG